MATLVNNYIFKALDAYPYELEEAMEALNYALSYDDKNITALCLMARIQAEALHDYDEAKNYFTQALAVNVNAFQVYPQYAKILIWNNDLEEAQKLIQFGLNIKGADKAVLYVAEAQCLEQLKAYKKALKSLKKAKEHTYNNDYTYVINQNKERIKGKMPKKKSKSKTKKKKKK